jgi:hypothetical protein
MGAGGKALAILGVALLVGTVVFVAVTSLNFASGPEKEFKTEVHSHMVNAYWSQDPDTMARFLTMARNGMHNLSLEDGDYSEYWGWAQTPDNQMAAQYVLMDSAIARCQEWKAWQVNNNGSSQQSDINTQKLNGLRAFISPADGGTWLDDIAEAAYYLKVAQFYVVWQPLVMLLMVIAGIVCVAFGWMLWDY